MEIKLIEEVNNLKIGHAVMTQKQDQTDVVIKKLANTLDSLDSKVTKGFYIALGAAIVLSGSVDDIVKVAIKLLG
jgi:hypothetical protein